MIDKLFLSLETKTAIVIQTAHILSMNNQLTYDDNSEICIQIRTI